MPDVLTKAYLVIPLSANAELMTLSLNDKFINFDRMGLVGGANSCVASDRRPRGK